MKDITKCKETIGQKSEPTRWQQESQARYPEVLKRYKAAMKRLREMREVKAADPNCKRCNLAQKLGVVIGCECVS